MPKFYRVLILMYPSNKDLEHKKAVDCFLRSVERRAFQTAKLATGNHEDALDIVQDAMINWVKLYHEQDRQLWHVLFFKVLHSRITDWNRKQIVRRRVMLLIGGEADEDSETDFFNSLPDPEGRSPEEILRSKQLTRAILTTIESLPLKQKQVFTLRHWEGLSISETAEVMKISEGSIKTHLSRALSRLRELLKDVYESEKSN